MEEITWNDWLTRESDRKCRISGLPYVRRLDPEIGATVFTPVKIIDKPKFSRDAPITWHFPDLAGSAGG